MELTSPNLSVESAQISRLTFVARSVALVVAVVVLVVPPLLRQVVGIRHPSLWHWQLYSDHHLDGCDAYWTRIDLDGSKTLVDRAALVGRASMYQLPRQLRTLNHAQLTSVSSSLCGQLRKASPNFKELRLHARCTARHDWQQMSDGELDVCSPQGIAALRNAVQSYQPNRQAPPAERPKAKKAKKPKKPHEGRTSRRRGFSTPLWGVRQAEGFMPPRDSQLASVTVGSQVRPHEVAPPPPMTRGWFVGGHTSLPDPRSDANAHAGVLALERHRSRLEVLQ